MHPFARLMEAMIDQPFAPESVVGQNRGLHHDPDAGRGEGHEFMGGTLHFSQERVIGGRLLEVGVQGEAELDHVVRRATDEIGMGDEIVVRGEGDLLLGRAGYVAGRVQIAVSVDERPPRAHNGQRVGIDQAGQGRRVA